MADWGSWKGSGNNMLSLYTRAQSSLSPLRNHNMLLMADNSGASAPAFCTPDTVDECIACLNQELLVLGYPSLYTDGQTLDRAQMINCCYDLVRIQRRNAHIREELETRYHKSASEQERLQTLNSRLKSDVEQVKRELGQEQEKIRQLTCKNRSLQAKFKAEKEEVRRLGSVMHSRDLQYRHDLKKKERENVRLKERLHTILIDKHPDRNIGIEISHVLQRSDGRRGAWKNSQTNKYEEEMYRELMARYEDRQQELLSENMDLRDSLKQMQREVISLIHNRGSPANKHEDDSLSDDQASCVADSMALNGLSDGHFQMPFDMVRGHIETSFHGMCRRIRQNNELARDTKIERRDSVGSDRSATHETDAGTSPGSATDGEETEVDRVKRKLLKYKEIVRKQEALIQQSIQSQTVSVENSFLHESQLLQERECLAKEKQLFYQQKSHFEQERQQFTDAAIRLGRERKNFEEERGSLLQQHFMHLSPFAVASVDGSTHSPHKESSRLLPATPTFSPAPKIKTSTPSTNELYRILGLVSTPSSPSKKSCVPVSALVRPASTECTDLSSKAATGPEVSHNIRGSPGPSMRELSDSLDSLKLTLFGKP